MQIETSQNAAGHQVRVKDVIKTIEDSSNFKKSVADILAREQNAKISVHILDSYIITSSIIGALLKMIQKDKANITVHVYNADLLELLDKLNLVALLNVKKEF